jgi:hypothetical protein
MLFFSLTVFCLCIWLLPWWGVFFAAGFLGWILPGGLRRTLEVTLSAALVAVAVAFVSDERSFGLISKRMSGVFSLPFSSGIFVVLGVIVALTAFFGYRSGMVLRTLSGPHKSSSF